MSGTMGVMGMPIAMAISGGVCVYPFGSMLEPILWFIITGARGMDWAGARRADMMGVGMGW